MSEVDGGDTGAVNSDSDETSQQQPTKKKSGSTSVIGRIVTHFASRGGSSITITRPANTPIAAETRYKLERNVFVLGDFNFNLLVNDNRKVFKSHIQKSLGFNILNHEFTPTRCNNSLIDWCLK